MRSSSTTDVFQISNLKDKIQRIDEEFDELRTQALGRKLKYQFEENKYADFSDFKSKMFVPPTQEDLDLKDLLDFIKEPNARARTYETEKLLIQRELKNYEKKFLNVRELELKKSLEELIKQRDDLKEREDSLFNEILRFKNVFYESENMRLEGDRINSKFLEERKTKVQTLKIFRNKLENERLTILDKLQRIQSGEIERKNDIGIRAAHEILVDGKVPYHDTTFMKGKIQDDAKRLYIMKVF